MKWKESAFKYVRAHCYCASLVRTLFIGHARATSFSSARTDSKTQQNIERQLKLIVKVPVVGNTADTPNPPGLLPF